MLGGGGCGGSLADFGSVKKQLLGGASPPPPPPCLFLRGGPSHVPLPIMARRLGGWHGRAPFCRGRERGTPVQARRAGGGLLGRAPHGWRHIIETGRISLPHKSGSKQKPGQGGSGVTRVGVGKTRAQFQKILKGEAEYAPPPHLGCPF